MRQGEHGRWITPQPSVPTGGTVGSTHFGLSWNSRAGVRCPPTLAACLARQDGS